MERVKVNKFVKHVLGELFTGKESKEERNYRREIAKEILCKKK